jgi:N-acetylglutamate synthase-like GNAT family acetyltransferase
VQQAFFRRATSADIAKVRELTRAAYAKWVPLIGREPKPMSADYGKAVAEHVIDLYELDGQLLGLIEVIPTPTHLLVENVAVFPGMQGKGIGDQLIRHAESVARTLQLPELRLYTNAAFTTNLGFYLRRGFEEFRREPLAAGGVIVHMRKPVKP